MDGRQRGASVLATKVDVAVRNTARHTLDAALLTGLDRVLDELRTDADLVLIDSPPLLKVGDALALTSHVDGLLILGSLLVLSFSIEFGPAQWLLRGLSELWAGLPSPGGVA
jgi:hypothetical protein